MLLKHATILAASLPRHNTGSKSDAIIPTNTITTSSSVKVNAFLVPPGIEPGRLFEWNLKVGLAFMGLYTLLNTCFRKKLELQHV
jgi:hypothetical protein